MKTSKSTYNMQTIVSFGGLMALLLGGAVAMFLLSRNADIRQQAMSVPRCSRAGICMNGLYCPAVGAPAVVDARCSANDQTTTIQLKSCGARENVFTDVPLNTTTCTLDGTAYYECSQGFRKVGNTCVPVQSPVPTYRPTSRPTARPTGYPTNRPTSLPTSQPTNLPTARPSFRPTSAPSYRPTIAPTIRPVFVPTP